MKCHAQTAARRHSSSTVEATQCITPARIGFSDCSSRPGAYVCARCGGGDGGTEGTSRITLKADGEHCVVRGLTIVCSDMAAYLRDTLKLPRETTIYLQAISAASYRVRARNVLDIIEKSGFNHPVAYLTDPKSSADK